MKEPTAAGGDAAITAGGSGNGPNPPGPTAEAGEARREAEVAPPRAGGGSGAARFAGRRKRCWQQHVPSAGRAARAPSGAAGDGRARLAGNPAGR